ncbi:MAG: hypothetical protein J5632_06455 [Bacteroidales bacterium]|nr:hypothetical protein [Bacteroidales bacterium]
MRISALYNSVAAAALAAALWCHPLNAQEHQNAALLLQGVQSGVRVSPVTGAAGEELSVLVRGGNGIRGAGQPLWIVDGIEVNPAVSYLNINDITGIKVLKNNFETAEWGSRGANGVVLVTTGMDSPGDKYRLSWKSEAGAVLPVQKFDGVSAALSHNHYLAVAASTANTRYGVSAWLRRTAGVEKRNRGLAGGARAVFDAQAGERLRFGMNSAFVLGSLNTVACRPAFGESSLTLLQHCPEFFRGQSVAGWEKDFDDESMDKRLTNATYLAFAINPFLSLRVNLGFDLANTDRYVWYGNGTPVGLQHNGLASMQGNTDFSYNANAVLSWARFIARDHRLALDIAPDARGVNTKRNTMQSDDFFSHTLRARGLVLYNGEPDICKYDYDYFSFGGYGRLGYRFKELAGLDALLRCDYAPRYDDAAVLRKSASAWFDAGKAFFPGGKTVSGLRIEASYGEAARERNLPYIAYGELLTGDFGNIPGNLQLFYEGLWRLDSREATVLAELGLLEGRISMGAGFFARNVDDAFASYSFGRKNGYYWERAPRSNHFNRLAKTGSRGVEADFKALVLKKKDLSWNVYANFAYNESRILDTDIADLAGDDLGNGFTVTANVLGYAPASFYGYRTGAEGKPADLTNDGVVDKYDRVVLGGSQPKFYGAAGTNLSFGKLSVGLLATWAAGHKIADLNGLLIEGGPDYRLTDKYLHRGDYFRISRISAGYRLPDFKIAGKAWNAELSLNAYDILTVTGCPLWNPAITGVDYGNCPASAAVLLGVKLGF